MIGMACLTGACGATVDGEEWDGELGTAQQESQWSCDVGFAYNGGQWRKAVLRGDCPVQTETFSFGVASDIPLMFGGLFATFGTSGGRAGYFYIDRDASHSWNSGDTGVRFLSYAAGDQPFALRVVVKHRDAQGNCTSGSGGLEFPYPVVGIKRGTNWYIDGNGNGTWDGTNQCDILYTGYGLSTDIAVPINGRIATSRAVENGGREWYIDWNGSGTWNGPSIDLQIKNFGIDTWRPFSDTLSDQIGVQNGRSVYLNADSNFNWSSGDIDGTNYLPSSFWRFVGWYTEVSPPT